MYRAEFFARLEPDVNAAVLDEYNFVSFVGNRGMELSAVVLDRIKHAATVAAPPATAEAVFAFLRPSAHHYAELLDFEALESFFTGMDCLYIEQHPASATGLKKWIREYLFPAISEDRLIESYRSIALFTTFKGVQKNMLEITEILNENIPHEFSSDVLARMHDAIQNYNIMVRHVDVDEMTSLLERALRAILELGGQYFFITHGGRIGYSAHPASPNDCVCFIPGGQFLHVLSPGLDRYVAAASVPDFMGSDIVEILKTEDSWQRVTLH